jgi:hypothetical protein
MFVPVQFSVLAPHPVSIWHRGHVPRSAQKGQPSSVVRTVGLAVASDVDRLRGQREVNVRQAGHAGINRYADNAWHWLASQVRLALARTGGMLCGLRTRLSVSPVSPSVLTTRSTPRASRAGQHKATALCCQLA